MMDFNLADYLYAAVSRGADAGRGWGRRRGPVRGVFFLSPVTGPAELAVIPGSGFAVGENSQQVGGRDPAGGQAGERLDQGDGRFLFQSGFVKTKGIFGG